jgi:SAM-dependent methyltransferase
MQLFTSLFKKNEKPADPVEREQTTKELIQSLDNRHRDKTGRFQRAVKLAKGNILPHVSSGRMLEIGAQHQPIGKHFPTFEYWSMDIRKTADNVVVGDITSCPELESEQFDVIVSLDVFEHLNRPWKAAEEIIRLLKPGGIAFTTTIFSWRYHPSPIDYYRYTPDALEFLFSGLETIHKSWDYTERRIKNWKPTSIEPLDELEGWRESVRVNYVGRKPA